MKSEHLKAARSALRSRFPILFQKEAVIELILSEYAVFEQFENGERRASSVKDAHFAPVLANWRALRICWAAVRSACRTIVDKLEKGSNLAEEEQKENELAESSCFGERLFDCCLLPMFELVHCIVSSYTNGERWKPQILRKKQKIKKRFYQRISGFCFSPSGK
jgi:hypothetical protein